jgi:hypothetical protein
VSVETPTASDMQQGTQWHKNEHTCALWAAGGVGVRIPVAVRELGPEHRRQLKA